MRSQPLPGAIKARAGWLWSSQGGAPVSGMEPWPPATVDLASAPRAHPTSERPAARAQLEFGRASSLAAAVRTAAGEDRTHDLRIMRPTRCQLRYCHDENFAKLGASSRMRPARSCAASISTRFWQVTQTAEPLFIRSMPQRMAAQGLPAVVRRWPSEVCTPYLQSEPTQSRMQCQLDASLPIAPLPLLCGR